MDNKKTPPNKTNRDCWAEWGLKTPTMTKSFKNEEEINN